MHLPRPKRQPKGDYEVGYARPPKSGQFKTGEVRNSKGRAKRGKSFSTDFVEQLFEQHEVSANGKSQKLTQQQILIKQLMNKAMKGDTKAAQLVIALIGQIIGYVPPPDTSEPLDANEEEILNDFVRRRAQDLKDE